MGMSIGAQDTANIAYKSQLAGQPQQLRADQTIKETDKSRETEKTRDSDPESTTSSGSTAVTSSGNARRSENSRKLQGGQDRSVGRLGRGSVEWGEDTQETGQWLPPGLQPQSRSAGTASNFNIPYWLLNNGDSGQSSSPSAQHQRLLTGLRTMVNNELQQYVKSNEPPYSKKTLRDIHGVLSDGGSSSADGSARLTTSGDPGGYNKTNTTRARNTLSIFDQQPKQTGVALEMVA